MKQNENSDELDMSLFANADLELNLDLDPVDLKNLEEEEGGTPPDVDPKEDPEEDPKKDEIISEEETPEEVAEEEGEEEEGDDPKDDSPNLYSSFASVLNEQGLLPSLDLQKDSIQTEEDLVNAVKSEISNQAKQYLLSKVGEDGYEALEKGISLAEYQQYQNTVNSLENINEDTLTENIDLAKKIILQDYINQGMSESKAMRILNKSVDLGEESVLEDARDSLESLKAFEQQRLAKQIETRQAEELALAKQQEKIDNDLKNAIYNSEELVPGLGKVNKNMQDKVYQSITKIVGEHNGVAENKLMKTRRENPIDFDTKLYYLFELTDGFNKFDKIVNKSTSKASEKLERALRSNKFTGSDRPAFLDDKESYGGIGSELVF